jgi:hypothetical protein
VVDTDWCGYQKDYQVDDFLPRITNVLETEISFGEANKIGSQQT